VVSNLLARAVQQHHQSSKISLRVNSRLFLASIISSFVGLIMTTTSAVSEVLSTSSTVPYRQIRAKYDDETITVYQAYSAAIAIPAVKEQKLSASPEFKRGRMTWVKPSWCWMMYPFLANPHEQLLRIQRRFVPGIDQDIRSRTRDKRIS
jgi:hypothetical protein